MKEKIEQAAKEYAKQDCSFCEYDAARIGFIAGAEYATLQSVDEKYDSLYEQFKQLMRSAELDREKCDRYVKSHEELSSINETLMETATKEPEAFILVNALKMLNNEQLKSTALSMLERTDYKNELLEALKRVRETIIKAGDVFTWASELKIIDNALAGEVSNNRPMEVLRELQKALHDIYDNLVLGNTQQAANIAANKIQEAARQLVNQKR